MTQPIPVWGNPDEEKYRKIIDVMEENLRKMGVYMTAGSVTLDPSGGDVLFVTFQVGDIAFTDRVQDPEKDKLNDEIRGMETEMNRMENRELRNELQADLEDFDDEA